MNLQRSSAEGDRIGVKLVGMFPARCAILLVSVSILGCAPAEDERPYYPMAHGEVALEPDGADHVHYLASFPRDRSSPSTVMWIAPKSARQLGLGVLYQEIPGLRLHGTDGTIADAGAGFYARQPDGSVVRLELTDDEIAHLEREILPTGRTGNRDLLQPRVVPSLHRIAPCAEPPPDRRRLSDVWIAVGVDHCAYRLELREDGTGAARRTCRMFGEPEILHYRIEAWSVTGRDLEMQLLPREPEDPVLRLSGTACEGCLFLDRDRPNEHTRGSPLRFYRLAAFEKARSAGPQSGLSAEDER